MSDFSKSFESTFLLAFSLIFFYNQQGNLKATLAADSLFRSKLYASVYI